MENDSLEALKSLIEEEIYLIPEDREAILAQMETHSRRTPAESATEPIQVIVAVSAEISASAPKHPEPKSAPLPIVEEVVSEPIPVRGNFSKGLLILHEESSLPAEVMEMLVKMINACGHSMNEVGLLASEHLEGRSMEDFQNLNAHTILKFGRVKHPINAVPARPYEVYSEKETEFLFADSLTVIAEEVALKKKLWTSLQVLFNLTKST